MTHEAGKGSRPRPFSVSKDEFDNRFDAIFGKKKKEILPEFELNKSTGEVEKVYPEDIQGIDEEQRRQAMKKDGFEE
jgi:hypothetical protein